MEKTTGKVMAETVIKVEYEKIAHNNIEGVRVTLFLKERGELPDCRLFYDEEVAIRSGGCDATAQCSEEFTWDELQGGAPQQWADQLLNDIKTLRDEWYNRQIPDNYTAKI